MQGEPRFRGFPFSGGPAGPKTPIAPEGGFGYVAGIMNKIVGIVAVLAVLAGLPIVAAASYHLVEFPARRALRRLGEKFPRRSKALRAAQTAL